MTYEMPIEGTHQIPGFNGVGVIDLEDYITKKILPPSTKGGEFSHIGVFDLNTIEAIEPFVKVSDGIDKPTFSWSSLKSVTYSWI